MVRRSRGTTMVEMITVLTIFMGVMAAIMSFYVTATQASQRQERISKDYRTAVQHAARVETLLAHARIYQVQDDCIIFACALGWPDPMTIRRRWPQYETTCSTLFVDTDRVLLHKNDVTHTLFMLSRNEEVSFSGSNRRVLVKVSGRESETYQPYEISHDILLENAGMR